MSLSARVGAERQYLHEKTDTFDEQLVLRPALVKVRAKRRIIPEGEAVYILLEAASTITEPVRAELTVTKPAGSTVMVSPASFELHARSSTAVIRLSLEDNMDEQTAYGMIRVTWTGQTPVRFSPATSDFLIPPNDLTPSGFRPAEFRGESESRELVYRFERLQAPKSFTVIPDDSRTVPSGIVSTDRDPHTLSLIHI